MWFAINLFISYLSSEASHLATTLLMLVERVLLHHTVTLSPCTLQGIEYQCLVYSAWEIFEGENFCGVWSIAKRL